MVDGTLIKTLSEYIRIKYLWYIAENASLNKNADVSKNMKKIYYFLILK